MIILGFITVALIYVAIRWYMCCKSVKKVEETPVDNQIYDEIDSSINDKTNTVGLQQNPAYDTVHT